MSQIYIWTLQTHIYDIYIDIYIYMSEVYFFVNLNSQAKELRKPKTVKV